MPLQPGPFRQQSQTDVPFTAGKYDFAGETSSDLSELDTIGATIDAEMVELVLFANADETLIIGENLDNLVSDIFTFAGSDFMPQLGAIDGAMNLAESQFSMAVAFAPAAAWTDPPGPYIPPSTVNIVAPVIPANGFMAKAGSPVSGAPTSGATGSVALYNTTRVGQPNFWVGDDFEVDLAGASGSGVTLTATHNGQLLATSQYGPIPSSGQFAINGTIGPENLGAWHEDWAISGVLIASFDFLVLSA